MLTRSQTTILLQIFSELALYSKVNSKSIKVADDTFQSNSKCEWVNMLYISLTYPTFNQGVNNIIISSTLSSPADKG